MEKVRLWLAWMLSAEFDELRQNWAVVPLSANAQFVPECGWEMTAPEMLLRPLVGIEMHERVLVPVPPFATVNCCVNVLLCRAERLSGVMLQIVLACAEIVNAELVAG